MAEVIGVVASGIAVSQLAIQIVSNVKQILEFWSTVKGAPEDVQTLLEELDLLGNLLSEIDEAERDEQSPATQQITSRILRYCQIALKNIDGVLKDPAGGLTSSRGSIRQWSAIKMAMKEKRLEKSMARLERAKSLLNLAYQCSIQFAVDSSSSSIS